MVAADIELLTTLSILNVCQTVPTSDLDSCDRLLQSNERKLHQYLGDVELCRRSNPDITQSSALPQLREAAAEPPRGIIPPQHPGQT